MKAVQIKVIARWVAGNCVAELSHNPEVKAKGRSVEEAVGALVLTQQEEVGVAVEVIPAKLPE